MAYSHNKRLTQQTYGRRDRNGMGEQGFTCLQCRQYVSCAPSVAGVQNRNHCPACLWSRHLDWRSAGDRLSTCRAAMRPVGLTTKHGRNKYARERDGEMMIIHRCTGCETVVINRIAADDSAAALGELFTDSWQIGATARADLENSGVSILTVDDGDLVRRRLFGEGRAGIPGETTSAVA